ncbi:MAG: phosphotransferase family protein, partial [Dehalococcoidia bacterium]
MKKYLLPQVESWKEWGGIFTDVAVWEPVVRDICSLEGLPFSPMEASFPGTNAVFILDRKYVVKVFTPFWQDFDVELELHAVLSSYGKIPIPSIVSTGVFADRIDWPYLITEYINGTPMREVREHIGKENLLEMGKELGEIVRELHQINLATVKSVERTKESWSVFLQRRRAQCISELRQKAILPRKIVDELQVLLQKNIGQFEQCPLALVHGDLTEEHLLLEQREDKWVIIGLIDFGDARAGARKYELP